MSFIANRREFLMRLGAAGASAAAVKELVSIGNALQQQADSAVNPEPQDDVAFEHWGPKHYLLDPAIVYLNHASIGTIPKIVHQARAGYLRLCETNPWLHMWGGAWEQARETVRAEASKLLNCRSTETAITHNTTEVFNVLAHGLPLGKGDQVLFSTLCHDGACQPFLQFANDRGFQAKRFEFPLDRLPTITAQQVVDIYAEQITPATRVLVLPHIDNTVGLRYPIDLLTTMARSKGVQFVVVDAAQSVGMIPVDATSLGVDVLATSPHKWLQAPKGLGLAYFSEQVQELIRPMWVTWGQKRWNGTARIYEDYGTRNLAELLCLGDAIEFHSALSSSSRTRRLQALWQHARDLVDQTDSLRWRSPRDWNMAASLYCVQLSSSRANKMAQDLFEKHRMVVRPFETLGLNALRISPNVSNTRSEIDSIIGLIRT